jgi:hypothetical protein
MFCAVYDDAICIGGVDLIESAQGLCNPIGVRFMEI